jgi:hypothetical protein
MVCAPGLVFGGTEGVGYRFHVLLCRTRFWRYRGHAIPFSCFPLPDMFLWVPRASGPFFTFCAPGLIFGGTEGVGSSLHVLRARTHFRRYRGRWVPFSCFAFPDSFLAVPSASGPVFIFCAPGLIFGARGRRVPFSCFARPDSFSAVPMASGPVFMSRSRTRFRRY